MLLVNNEVGVVEAQSEPLHPEQRDAYRARVLALEAFGHRGSATTNERLAADYLAGELTRLGLHAEQEKFAGCRSSGSRFLLHLAVAALGLLFIYQWPLVSAVLASVSVLSLWIELVTPRVWLSRRFVRHPSQNVVATIPATGSARLRIVVSGHYDTQRTGLIWSITKWLAPLQWYLPAQLKSPLLPLAFFIVVQACVSILISTQSDFASSASIKLALVCIIATYLGFGLLLGQMAVGPFVPGAADNASGAAAVLSIAEAWQRTPIADVELVLLLTGCEETVLLGSSAWISQHKTQIQDTPTIFLNIDCIGMGSTRLLGWEVPVLGLPVPYPADLLSIAIELSRQLRLEDIGPFHLPGPTDGLAFLRSGIAGISVVGFQGRGHLPNYHQMSDTSERLDFESAYQGIEFSWMLLQKMASPKTS